MARKSRKHQTVTLPHLHSETAGYIRLSVTGKGGDDSIENQKKLLRHGRKKTSIPYRDGTLIQDGAAEHSIDRSFGI